MRIDDYPEQMQLQFLSSSSISEVERNYTSPNEMINNIGKEFSSWVLLHPYLILDIILLLLSLIPNLSCLHLVLKRLLSSSTTKTTRGYLHVSMLTCAITFSVIAMLLHTTTIDAELLPFSKIPTPYIFSNYSFCALILALFLLPAGAMPSNLGELLSILLCSATQNDCLSLKNKTRSHTYLYYQCRLEWELEQHLAQVSNLMQQ